MNIDNLIKELQQIDVEKLTDVELEQTDTISNDTDRGSGGFGSTGAF